MCLILNCRKTVKQKTKIPTSIVNKCCHTPPLYTPYLCSRAADFLGCDWISI